MTVLPDFRLLLMGGTGPTFMVTQNMASHSDDALTRVLTFNYLAAMHAWHVFSVYAKMCASRVPQAGDLPIQSVC